MIQAQQMLNNGPMMMAGMNQVCESWHTTCVTTLVNHSDGHGHSDDHSHDHDHGHRTQSITAARRGATHRHLCVFSAF